MTSIPGTAILALAMAELIVMSANADNSVASSPPDTTHYSRPLLPEDLDPLNTGNLPSPIAPYPERQKPATSPIRKPNHPKPEGN
jgi:hypothetical protein